jgi:hypothetical protein
LDLLAVGLLLLIIIFAITNVQKPNNARPKIPIKELSFPESDPNIINRLAIQKSIEQINIIQRVIIL